jgi:hydrogenase expression/formation protein HypC
MCLGIPGRVVERRDDDGILMGKVTFGAIAKWVCLAAVPEAEIGDYVLVHVGFALSRLDEEEAARVFQLLDELGELGEIGGVE